VHAVIDTNALVTGLLWKGAPHTLLDTYVPRGDLVLCTSPVLVAELYRVLEYPRIAQRARATGLDARAALSAVLAQAEIYEDVPPVRVIKEDPSDNEVLAVALIADVDLIISGDHHLRRLKSFKGIDILTPRGALQILRREER